MDLRSCKSPVTISPVTKEIQQNKSIGILFHDFSGFYLIWGFISDSLTVGIQLKSY